MNSKQILPSLLICVSAVFAFFPCLSAEFLNFDDDGHILNNPAVAELSFPSLKQMFTQTLNSTYVPLTTLSFAVEKHFFGFDPFVFHLNNLLLHIAVTLLIFFLAQRLGLSLRAALLAALIFAVHPMRVENVAWVTERKDVLYALFYVLALHQYWSYLKSKSRVNYWTAAGLGLLSMLAKPMALSLPLILWLLDWFSGRPWQRSIIVEKLPFLAVAAGIGWVTFSLNLPPSQLEAGHALLIWIWSFDFYIWKFLFPQDVSPFYSLPGPVSAGSWPFLASIVMFIACIGLLALGRKDRFLLFAFGFYFLSIFFLLRFRTGDLHFVADRFMYLPSIGLCFLLGMWLDRWIKSRWAATVGVFLFIFMAIETHAQCYVWRDSISLWSEMIRRNPEAETVFFAYSNRGNVFLEQGRDDLALADYNQAIAINPKAAKAYSNRGRIYAQHGQYDKAIEDFSRAIALDTALPEALINRALAHQAKNDIPSARRDALEAKRLGAKLPEEDFKRLEMENPGL